MTKKRYKNGTYTVKSLLFGTIKKAVFRNGYVTCNKIRETMDMFLDKNEVIQEVPGATVMYDLVRLKNGKAVEVLVSNEPLPICQHYHITKLGGSKAYAPRRVENA